MRNIVIPILCICLSSLAPAAHAGKFKKILVLGAAVVATKAMAKHQENKKQKQQAPQEPTDKNHGQQAPTQAQGRPLQWYAQP